MGLLKFTKEYTASDDSSTLGGADLGTMQADIAAILNGGITNTNISTSAAITESKLAFDTASGHNHDGSNSRTISSGAFRGFRQGCGLTYVTAATLKAGSGVLDIAGSLYTRTSYSSTINMATDGDWVEGTTQEGASQIVYVYAYNDSGSTWDIKFWLQAPQYANTGTDDSSKKIYRYSSKWYRCLGYFYNDASQNIQSKTVENIDGFSMFQQPWWAEDKDGVTFAKTTVYQALTDGIITATHTGGADSQTTISTASDLGITANVFTSNGWQNDGANGYGTTTNFVKRDYYWSVTDSGNVTIKFMPIMRNTDA